MDNLIVTVTTHVEARLVLKVLKNMATRIKFKAKSQAAYWLGEEIWPEDCGWSSQRSKRYNNLFSPCIYLTLTAPKRGESWYSLGWNSLRRALKIKSAGVLITRKSEWNGTCQRGKSHTQIYGSWTPSPFHFCCNQFTHSQLLPICTSGAWERIHCANYVRRGETQEAQPMWDKHQLLHLWDRENRHQGEEAQKRTWWNNGTLHYITGI